MYHWDVPLVISQSVDRLQGQILKRFGYRSMFVLITGCTAMLSATLHGLEAAIWAVAYLLVGAVPDYRHAVLYSLGAMTTYGHASVLLESA